MSVHYDALDINRDIRLDLPLREGTGTITHSVAPLKPRVTLVNGPTFGTLDSYLGVLYLDGVNQHLTSPQADTTTLDFTSGDYSLGGWFFISSGEDDNKTLMSRFLLNNNGWELYHYTNQILTLRHHHSLYTPPGGADPRTSSYSENWSYNKWWFMGISRPGGEDAIFYRGDINGFGVIPTISSAGGLADPEGCNQNLYIGCNPLLQNFFYGRIWRPRAWARALTAADWQGIYEREVRWFLS